MLHLKEAINVYCTSYKAMRFFNIVFFLPKLATLAVQLYNSSPQLQLKLTNNWRHVHLEFSKHFMLRTLKLDMMVKIISLLIYFR